MFENLRHGAIWANLYQGWVTEGTCLTFKHVMTVAFDSFTGLHVSEQNLLQRHCNNRITISFGWKARRALGGPNSPRRWMPPRDPSSNPI